MNRPPRDRGGDQAFLRDDLAGRQSELTYAGVTSMLRRTYTRDLSRADIAFTGIPFDLAASGRPGARFGPRAIRAASTGLAELPPYPWGFEPFDYLAVADYGDCYFDYGHPYKAVEAIEAHAAEIVGSDTMMIAMGGDHFVTYPILRAHADRYGPLSLIHFDAHSDTWADDGKRLDHGSMFLRAAREGIIDPSRSVQVGIRTFNHNTHGFTVVGAPFVHREGTARVARIIAEVVGDNQAYLTFDIDCLDPAFAPGTGTPVAGGLSTSQAFELIRSLGWVNLVGADVVEVAPAYDLSDITSVAAATIIHDLVCLEAIKAGAEPLSYGMM